ncbi:MAG: hypothetical protein VKP72_04150 [bacterium]|nr:hypothetical protein [bacterium]
MRRPILRILNLGILAATLLTACGRSPVSSSDRLASLRTAPTPLPTMPIQQGPRTTDPQVVQLLTAVSQAYGQLRTLAFTLKGFGIDMKTGKTGTNEVDYAFETPTKTACKILNSSDPKTVGTKCVWLGGQQMTVHTKFIGFWVTVPIDVHDDRAGDLRGFYIDETSIPRTMQTLLEPSNQVQLLGASVIDGAQCARLGVLSPKSLRGIKREVFAVDPRRAMMVQREMFDSSDRLVFRITLTNIRINQPLPSDAFIVK